MEFLGFSGDWASASQAQVLRHRDWVVRTSGRPQSSFLCGGESTYVLLFCVVVLYFCSVCFYFCSVFWFCFWLVRSVLRTLSHVWCFVLGIVGVYPFWCSCVSQYSLGSFELIAHIVTGMVDRCLSHLLVRFVRFVHLTCRARSPFQLFD